MSRIPNRQFRVSLCLGAVLLVSGLIFLQASRPSSAGNKDKAGAEKSSTPESKLTTAQSMESRRTTFRDRSAGQTDSGKGNSRPPQEYIGFGGHISSDLKKEFGLSTSQSEALQNLTSEFWVSLASWAAKSISYDATASEAAPDGASIYRLPAMQPTEREEMLQELASRYEGVAGRTVSDALVTGLNQNNAFAFTGKYDAVIRITTAKYTVIDARAASPSNGIPATVHGELAGSYVLSVPRSGKIVYSMEGVPFSQLSGTFGNIFQK